MLYSFILLLFFFNTLINEKVIFAICHIGFVTKYLSDVIVMGFTTGAAFHIVLSQVNPLLGITTGKLTTPFKLIEVYFF